MFTFTLQGTINAIAGDSKNIVKWKYSDDIITTSEKVARFACPTNIWGWCTKSCKCFETKTKNKF